MSKPSGAQVLVVGAGIIGRSIAYYLSRAGAHPTLIEASAGPSEASRASLGVLTHFSGGASTYALFIRDSHAAHEPLAGELADETGIDVGWRPLGGIDLVIDDEDEERVEGLWNEGRARGVVLERLDADSVHKMEPVVSGAVRWGLLFPEDQRVAPMLLGQALLEGAVSRGAHVHYDERLLHIEACADGGIVAQTSRARRHADFVVLAAGAWTARLAESIGASVPVRPVRGQHGCFAGPALRHVLRQGGHQLLSGARGTLVGATAEEVGFVNETTQEAARALGSVHAQLLKGPSVLRSQGAGLRAKPKAGRPMIGPLSDHPRVFIATGHYKNGVLMGPLTGQVVTRWLLTGDPGRDMEPFVPER